MSSEGLIRLSATEAVALLRRKEVSPLELIDAAAALFERASGLNKMLPIEPRAGSVPE